ncbi:hypothetical protein Tco_1070806 [Tanacetum coccineum]|uniref:Uncharacterized protein n=1 Tax=Tanacetum coccineum TaxID=301880 RepID=A0ABQ5HNK9_9ASTR
MASAGSFLCKLLVVMYKLEILTHRLYDGSAFYDLEVDLFPDVAFVSALISVAAPASQTKVYLFVSPPIAASSSAVDLLQLLNK